MTPEQIIARWPFAIIHLAEKESGLQLSVPAALVFDTPDGFAYLEPGYLDPDNAEHRFHRVVCTWGGTVNGEGAEPVQLAFSGPEWEGEIRRYTGTPREPALDHFPALLAAQRSRTLPQERAHQRKHLAEDLA